ncbi:MAG: glycoside hydrolase family 88 protein [Prevotella sp.]|nr:glycoside hydrolase family 88 protein [Prevotella sp.]
MKHETLTFRFLDMSRGGFARLFLLLLLPCLSVIGVKAADSNGGVKFNSSVRYSQWAINSRLYDFKANTKAFGFAKFDSKGGKSSDRNNKEIDKLDYVPGLVAKATIEAADYYQGFDWSNPWFLSVKEYGDTYYQKVPTGGGSLDDLNAVKLYIGLYNNTNATDADKSNYKKAIGLAQEGLKAHNTIYSIQSGTLAGDAVVGGWFHKTAYNNQMWLDGAYMGSALLAQIVNFNGTGNHVFESTTADWDMVTKQLNIVWNMCWNPTDKLMYHAFEANAGTGTGTNESKSHAETWAGLNGKTESYTFHSAAYWGRANAWYLMALVDVLEAMKNAGQESTENYKTLKQHLADLADGIAARQDPKTGGWYQVMDDPSFKATSYNGKSSTASNYIETSATAIFAAAYFKAVRLGLLSTSPYDYKTIAKNAFECLVNNYTYLDNNGDMQIWGSCRSAGLGGEGTDYKAGGKKYRDGSKEYYLLGNDVPMVKQNEGITEGKVLGGFIMAATEYERAYQNQNPESKQILFAKDLAPSYDFTTTERELDATAYGNGDVSYQWYKSDGTKETKIADATSATYTPTESGSYYCEATANGKTITTSATNVTAKSNSNTDNGSTDNNNGGSENGTTTGNIFSYTIKTTEKDANTPYDAEGGTVTLGAAKDDTKNGYKLDGEFGKSVYIKITLSGTKLQEGDIIKISAYSATAGKGGLVAYTGTTEGSSSVSLGDMTQKSEDISYTVKASDILNGLSTFYIYRKTGESTYVKSISITRANTQVALTASFSPATISAKEGDVAKDLPALTVEAGETTLTANDYTVTYASDNDAVAKVENGKVTIVGEGETNIVATIKPTDTNKYKETSATFAVKVEKTQTPVDPTESEVIYNWNTIGSQKENIAVTEGTKNINGTSVPCINFGSNYNASRYTYMSIKDKDNGGFKAGDIITITGLYTGNKTTGIGMEIHTTREGKAVFSTPYYNKELQTYTYTLTEDCDSLFFGRYGGATPNVTELKVVRPAASTKQRLSANFDTNNIKVVKGTQSITLPNLTVKAGSTELTATSDYSVSYESDANEIAILNGTQVNFVSGKTGLVTITAKVTPTNATKYEGTEAYYQILIQDPTPLNISVTDIDMNATDAEIKEPVVKVYGENDQLLKLGTDYILSYKSNGGPVSFPDGKLTVAGSSYNWTEGTSTITVTATPTANMENAYKAGSVDFVYAVSKGLITPKFLDTFNNIIVKLATKTGSKDNTNTFTVPLIFNGEDVSSYFDYTYTISPSTNTQSVSGNVLTYTPKTAGTYTVTVSAKPKTNDIDPSQDYTDVYNVPANISFTLDVKDDYIRPVVKVNPVSIDMYTGTRVSSPDVTVTNYNGGAVIDETSYTISWTTFTPGICKVDDNGNIEAVSEGDGKIRVTIKGDKMESTTAFLKVLVDDPAMYRVKSNGETYGNQATMWNQDKTLSVTLGGWMFPNDGIPDTKILDQNKKDPEKLSNSYQWGTASSKAKWKLTGFDYYVSGNNSKNARQENGSNAMPETTTIGSADFKTYTTEVKDPMFNVPCSGSFLVFNPKTNGKVTAHIFQNGAFDTSGGKTSYRPQRRVFVMDEAGNFVTSTAHIESTNGKPTGGTYDLTAYGWDLNGGNAPTVADVISHFDGLESFEMTKDGFKNNVYPSALSTDIMPNKAIANHPGDKSAHGWCVLADSPVTYTFNVKAGKTYYLYNFGSKIGFYGFSFDEGDTKPTEVTFNDDQTNNIKTTDMAKVTVNRSMKKDVWTTCVLPFSLNKHQVDAIFGNTYSIGNENGTQILYFDRVENGKVYFVRHAYNTIVANKPFLIKPSKKVESISTAAATEYPYVTIEATKNENGKPDDWCTGNSYTWASSYSNDMIVKEGDGFISKDGLFKNFVGESGTLKGFRGYLKRLGTQTGAKPMMLQVVNSSNVDGDNGETTGIEDLIIDADGQLMPANGKVYNINGQLVSEDANSFQSLPSGIYIINGKKYIK